MEQMLWAVCELSSGLPTALDAVRFRICSFVRGIERATCILTMNSPQYAVSQTFTASYVRLSGNGMWVSSGLWVCLFAAKSMESYFMTLSSRPLLEDGRAQI